MSEATQPQNPTLEQTLNKTDLGHVLYENRKVFMAALLAVLLGATGYVLWKQARHHSAVEDSREVFEFQSKVWTEAQAGKVTPADLVAAFGKLDKEIQTAPVMLPVVLEMGKFLFEKGNTEEANTILSTVGDAHKSPVANFFLSMQRVVVLEKLGKVDEAIAILEKLASNKDVVMPAKVSVELGRLNLMKGEKAKAQTQFDYVISTFPNDEQAKLAKLYLSKLAE